jgi:hypothetical protein
MGPGLIDSFPTRTGRFIDQVDKPAAESGAYYKWTMTAGGAVFTFLGMPWKIDVRQGVAVIGNTRRQEEAFEPA